MTKFEKFLIKPQKDVIKKISQNEVVVSTIVFGFLLGLLIFAFFTPNYYTVPEPIEFKIESGSTLNQVIDRLHREDIIPSKSNMKIAAFLFQAATNIKAGYYRIPNGLSYFQLIELFLEGRPGKQKLVTIQEGIWQHNMAGLLKSELGIDSSKFIALSKNRTFLWTIGIKQNNAEGYLLPNTYYFFTNSKEEDIIVKLKDKMDEIFAADSVKEQMKKLKISKHQILTLASIIDGESNIESEFSLISGVYHNRLKRGMLLQADPTVQYLKRDSKRRNKIYYSDLEKDSPFNTYKHRGLPPAPINNPGKAAVLAAIFPERHNFYYFVADGTGGHVFARTAGEHFRNVNEYRRWRQSQK
ncbi:MAG: endolytic transglycosylase MltG [Bacteroidota bacterium]